MSSTPLPLHWTLALLAFLAIMPCHAGAQTLPETRVTIVPDAVWSPPETEAKQDFKCETGKVLIGRKRHLGDDENSDENDDTQYLCGRPMQHGAPVTLKDPEHSPWYKEHDHVFVAPADAFVTGRYHWKDEEGNSRYQFHRGVNTRGEKVWTQPEGEWYKHSEGGGPTFTCPDNQVIIARSHDGDENGETGYLCASLWAAPQRDAVGTIVLLDSKNVPCTLDVPNIPTGATWTYILRAVHSPCRPDDATAIQLFMVPSATRIVLGDGDTCEKRLSWIELRTNQQPTRMEGQGEGVKFPDLFKVANNRVIRPGVIKVDGDPKTNDLLKVLSCVRITVSAEPPAPTR